MLYRRFDDPKEFYDATFAVLLKHEAQNSIPLGNAVLGKNGGEPQGWKNPQNWYMSTVSDQEGHVLLAAIMTPPFNITMYETDNVPNEEALHCLCDHLCKEGVKVPGVTSENRLAERFAGIYTGKMNMEYEIHKNLRIYVLHDVSKGIPLTGNVRKAEKKDLCFLPYWRQAFQDDCGLGSESLEEALGNVEGAVGHGMLYVLEDQGMPVSMASALREVVKGRSIGMVYTPPYWRGKGYAGSCVAQVSQKVLDMGYEYVSLFTDLSNPVSNSIYQKIGYRPICDYHEVRFGERA